MIEHRTPYYAPTAYRSDRMPNQQSGAQQSWLKNLGKQKLPLGHTKQIAPENLVCHLTPRTLRTQEEAKNNLHSSMGVAPHNPSTYKHMDFHERHDHERLRHSLLSVQSHVWIYLAMFGKGAFIVLLLPSLFAFGVLVHIDARPWNLVGTELLRSFLSWFLGFPLTSWAIGSLVIHKLPNLWVKPSRGPIWELNRRTGLVTLFDYDNNGEYKKNGTIGELTAPFYEFDAYIESGPDRQGSMNHVLYIAHRYSDIVINFSSLVNIDNRWQVPCALWDFLQNYMDTSRPLPDLPRYEEFRHLDPTTAAYDKKTGRNPRYWIDMDDENFKNYLHQLLEDIDNIDTFQRPDLMARYVHYTD